MQRYRKKKNFLCTDGGIMYLPARRANRDATTGESLQSNKQRGSRLLTERTKTLISTLSWGRYMDEYLFSSIVHPSDFIVSFVKPNVLLKVNLGVSQLFFQLLILECLISHKALVASVFFLNSQGELVQLKKKLQHFERTNCNTILKKLEDHYPNPCTQEGRQMDGGLFSFIHLKQFYL